ncbi:MAG: S41 family peptidase, partial [Planctomycetota bacterium]
ISRPGTSEGGLFWIDDDTLTFASSGGTYKVDLPGKPGASSSPARLSSSSGSFVRRFAGGKAAWLVRGTPGTITTSGKTESYSFTARQALTQAGRMRTGFGAAWRLMKDNWYDPSFNNRDWTAVRDKYLPIAEAAADARQLGEVVSMMLGELNGSHLGFYPSGVSSYRPSQSWSESVGHLGVRFVDGADGPGWLVRDVLEGGPAADSDVDLQPGDRILAVDGIEVGPNVGPTAVLTGISARDVELTILDAESDEAEDKADENGEADEEEEEGDEATEGGEDEEPKSRTVILRPISYGYARSLLYQHWLEHNRQTVDELSGGKLGYLHIRSMNGSSLLEYERQLYNVGYGREGLIIDVRDNGGGSTADRLLTSLTQPIHAITVPRGGSAGYPQDRKVYASWSKPIVVLCNQNSFSNAEIFSHAIKTLRRGKVVGVRTAGGVISTGSATVTDVGRIRQPFRGWYVAATGEDMELNGAVPHVELWPQPGELPAGKDRQLEKAVTVLKKQVKKAKKSPPPALLKATDR